MNPILETIYRKDDHSLGRLLLDHRKRTKKHLDESLRVVLSDQDLDYLDRIRYGEMLLCAGANPSCKIWGEDTLLHYVIEKEDLELFNLLMNFAPDVNVTGEDDQTPLHIAARTSNAVIEDIISTLLNAGAKCNKRNADGDTPLNVAISEVNLITDAVRLLLIQTDINQKNKHGRSCIHLAVMHKKAEYLKLFLEDLNRCQCINAKDNLKNTALHYAAKSGNLENCKLLIEAGASVNILDDSQDTALHHAVFFPCFEGGEEKIVEILLKAGSDADARNEAGQTALFTAVYNRNWRSVRELILYNCDVNLTGQLRRKEEFSPLDVSILNGDLYCMYMLVAAGCNFVKREVDHALVKIMAQRLALNQSHEVDAKLPFEEIIFYVQNFTTKPISLRLSCRKSIRLFLGKNINSKLKKLDLPSKVIDFLSLQEFQMLV